MADKTNAELLKEFVGSYSPVFDVNPYEAKETVEIYPTPIVETMSYVDYARVEAAPLNLAFAQLKAKVLANDSTADIVTEAITAFTNSVNEFVNQSSEDAITGGAEPMIDEGDDEP